MAEYTITVRHVHINWIIGCIDDFDFEAKVYDEGSQFGIDGGRVSKLGVYQAEPKGELIGYDRGWETYPATPELENLLEALLKFCDSLPAQNSWQKTFEAKHSFLITDGFVLEYDENGNPC